MPYNHALQLQMKIFEQKKRGMERDVLLLLEHPPVITLGRSTDRKNLLVNDDFLKNRGVELFETDRGGDITFHGPGQLVGYPIITLRHCERDVREYMKKMEESLIRLLKAYGIQSKRNTGYTGVWTQAGKIAAMGVHISRWITRHGFALNVNTDLTFFDMIIPCGIEGKSVTSMQKQTECLFELQEVAEKYIPEFGKLYGRRMVRIEKNALIEELERF